MHCNLPEIEVWVSAPPSTSWVTSSWVTVFTTLGPVTNMYDVCFTYETGEVRKGTAAGVSCIPDWRRAL